MSQERSLLPLFTKLKGKRHALRVATHDGIFHADETMCIAILLYLCRVFGIELELCRTRDKRVLPQADILIDVGMAYDPDTFRFDHHQKDGAGNRESGDPEEEGTPYSAIGLFWKDYGHDFVKAVIKYEMCKISTDLDVTKIRKRIDKVLIEGICALDTATVKLRSNGIAITSMVTAIQHLNPVPEISMSWDADAQVQAQKAAAEFLIPILIGHIARAVDHQVNLPSARKAMSIQKNGDEPRILILKTHSQAWRGSMKGSDVLMVIQPRISNDESWSIVSVDKDVEEDQFEFPSDWRGVTSSELEKRAGVRGFEFVHESGTYAAAGTKQAALVAAKKALSLWDEERRN